MKNETLRNELEVKITEFETILKGNQSEMTELMPKYNMAEKTLDDINSKIASLEKIREYDTVYITSEIDSLKVQKNQVEDKISSYTDIIDQKKVEGNSSMLTLSKIKEGIKALDEVNTQEFQATIDSVTL